MDTIKIDHKTTSYEVYYRHDDQDLLAIFDSYIAALHFNNRKGINGQIVTHIQQSGEELMPVVSYHSYHFKRWYEVAREQLLDAHVQDLSDDEIRRAFKNSIGRQFWFDVVQEMRLNGSI